MEHLYTPYRFLILIGFGVLVLLFAPLLAWRIRQNLRTKRRPMSSVTICMICALLSALCKFLYGLDPWNLEGIYPSQWAYMLVSLADQFSLAMLGATYVISPLHPKILVKS